MTTRECATCATSNQADARFCEGCGTPLERSCTDCGAPAGASARFCRACGAPLDGTTDRAAQSPVRKTVTVMFADLAGSTGFEERVDAETAREVLGQYHDLLRSTAERHRAGVTKYIGDGFMAVWGVPEVGADDAGRAVEAAVELQERFAGFADRMAQSHGAPLALRVAVNTGEVVVGRGDADLVGDALNVCARLESECPHGHVVVGEETWRSTRGSYRFEPLGRVQVKGRAAPVAVYQWLGYPNEVPESAPFVGRSDEMHRLETALDQAIAARSARLVTVIGEPGVGKSRLAEEFAARSDAPRLHIRCSAEETVALGPFVEMLRSRDLDAELAPGLQERDRILRGLRGITTGLAGSVEETFWALRRYIEMLAAAGGLILILDDIQWADALLLDFVEHLAEWVREAPVVMLALTRAELRESRPDLMAVGGWVSDAIGLHGLEPDATAELAAQVLGGDRLPPELLSRLPISTGGNPLFVRELVGMLVQDGVLVDRQDGWRLTIDVDAISVPPTIQALLASRLERIDAGDRRTLEVASVIGTEFSPAALATLAGITPVEVRASLDRLRRLELAQPSGTFSTDEPLWRFHHVLVREVAYRRLLKSDRAELHERLANWLRDGGAGSAVDTDVARHLESAHGYRCDLGMRDADTEKLAIRSARSYLTSARRALDRDELVSAGTQAVRGAALAAGADDLCAGLLLVGCEALLSARDVAAVAPLIEELERTVGDALAPWATCYRCQYLAYTDPARLLEADDLLRGAIDEFTNRGDASGLAKAHRVRAGTRARMGRIGDAEADLFEALIAARRSADHRQITAALAEAPNAALWGPSPASKAGGRCLDVVRMQRMTTAAPSLEATSLRCLAVLELLRGRPDKARAMLTEARQIVADLGLRHALMETELFAGTVELLAGDPVAAEPYFRTALDGLDSLGLGVDAGQAAALLARSLLAQGRIDEAEPYAAESEHLAGRNLKTAILWRAVRAEILATQGHYDAAVDLAEESVALAAGTDLVLDHADACLALSRVLDAAGDHIRAATARSQADSLYTAKEAVFLARSAPEIDEPLAKAATAVTGRSRLSTANRASQILVVGPAVDWLNFAGDWVYEDRRKFGGEPIIGSAGFEAAVRRKYEQYPHLEICPLAVRGDTLVVAGLNWWDDSGNQTTSLDLYEVGDDGAIRYWARFDDDDFTGAYAELERRYYAGEGAEFAIGGDAAARLVEALNRNDLDAARASCAPGFMWHAPPAGLTSRGRTIDELFRWMQERGSQVSSQRHWTAVIRWLSPDCAVSRNETSAMGSDGAEYRWTRICTLELRHGLSVSVHEFDHEDDAFAYADSVIAQRPTRLAIANDATSVRYAVLAALQNGDLDEAVRHYSPQFEYGDHRRLSGEALTDRAGIRAAYARMCRHYNHFEGNILAVRGRRLGLGRYRCADDAGNETTGLLVGEIDEQGQIIYEGRFEEDDFEAAYADLEDRYQIGEGARYANTVDGRRLLLTAMDRLDLEAAQRCCHPDMRVFAPPTNLALQERTLEEFFDWIAERARQVAAVRNFSPVYHWISPSCLVARGDVMATGFDGERYSWARPYVMEFRGGLVSSMRQFDDEDEAFAYAEKSVAASSSRLPGPNRSIDSVQRQIAAMRAGDAAAVSANYREDYVFEDRRRLSGDPLSGRAAVSAFVERIHQQYSHFESRLLAVRGETCSLTRTRWADGAGNQSINLHVIEIDENDRIGYESRFDADDFDSAYAELERRYYAGEGKPFARSGLLAANFVAAMNRADFDTMFTTLATEELRIQNHSRSVFPDRSAAELRASQEELEAMLRWVRTWFTALCWVSPQVAVGRMEREGRGYDDVDYAWARVLVIAFRDDVLCSIHDFDADDEDAAFACAESIR